MLPQDGWECFMRLQEPEESPWAYYSQSESLQHFKVYLIGHKFEVFTEHSRHWWPQPVWILICGDSYSLFWIFHWSPLPTRKRPFFARCLILTRLGWTAFFTVQRCDEQLSFKQNLFHCWHESPKLGKVRWNSHQQAGYLLRVCVKYNCNINPFGFAPYKSVCRRFAVARAGGATPPLRAQPRPRLGLVGVWRVPGFCAWG